MLERNKKENVSDKREWKKENKIYHWRLMSIAFISRADIVKNSEAQYNFSIKRKRKFHFFKEGSE